MTTEKEIITISDSLWLVPIDNFFMLRDSVKGEALIDIEEIAPLIEALQAIAKEVKGSNHVSQEKS